MRLTKAMRWTVVAASTVLAVAACSNNGSSGDGGAKPTQANNAPAKDGGTFRLGIVEPTAIDPYNTQESEGTLVTQALFTGLTSVDADGKLSNALAETVPRTTTAAPGRSRSRRHHLQQRRAGGRRGVHPRLDPRRRQGRRLRRRVPHGRDRRLRQAPGRLRHHLLRPVRARRHHPQRQTRHQGLRVRPADLPHRVQPGDQGRRRGHQQDLQRRSRSATAPSRWTAPGSTTSRSPWSATTATGSTRRTSTGSRSPSSTRPTPTSWSTRASSRPVRLGPHAHRAARRGQGESTSPRASYLELGHQRHELLLPITFNGPLKSKEAREAVSYAIDRDAIVNGVFQGFATRPPRSSRRRSRTRTSRASAPAAASRTRTRPRSSRPRPA